MFKTLLRAIIYGIGMEVGRDAYRTIKKALAAQPGVPQPIEQREKNKTPPPIMEEEGPDEGEPPPDEGEPPPDETRSRPKKGSRPSRAEPVSYATPSRR